MSHPDANDHGDSREALPLDEKIDGNLETTVVDELTDEFSEQYIFQNFKVDDPSIGYSIIRLLVDGSTVTLGDKTDGHLFFYKQPIFGTNLSATDMERAGLTRHSEIIIAQLQDCKGVKFGEVYFTSSGRRIGQWNIK